MSTISATIKTVDFGENLKTRINRGFLNECKLIGVHLEKLNHVAKNEKDYYLSNDILYQIIASYGENSFLNLNITKKKLIYSFNTVEILIGMAS
jgi:hypothetical protein